MRMQVNLRKGPLAGWVRGDSSKANYAKGSLAVDGSSGELLVVEQRFGGLVVVVECDGEFSFRNTIDLYVQPARHR